MTTMMTTMMMMMMVVITTMMMMAEAVTPRASEVAPVAVDRVVFPGVVGTN
jgi:hypothetical protein